MLTYVPTIRSCYVIRNCICSALREAALYTYIYTTFPGVQNQALFAVSESNHIGWVAGSYDMEGDGICWLTFPKVRHKLKQNCTIKSFITYTTVCANDHTEYTLANPVTVNHDRNMKNSVHSRIHTLEDTWHLGRQMSHLSVQTKLEQFLQTCIIMFNNK
jgi:hypothetical protein